MQPKPGNNDPVDLRCTLQNENQHFERNMDLSMESAVNAVAQLGASGQLAGRPLEEWNAAYAKVESYFHALRVRNKALLGQLVLRVLERAMRRAPHEPERSATQLAAEEMDRLVTEWFAEVLRIAVHQNGSNAVARADGSRCCSPTCRANGRNNFCVPARGQKNLPAPCAKRFCAPGRIFRFQK